MPMWITSLFDSQSGQSSVNDHEPGDLSMDDVPPAERPSEQYSAWRATAIYNLAPFSAPPGR